MTRQARLKNTVGCLQWACYKEIQLGFFKIGILSYEASKKYYAFAGEHSNLSYLEYSRGIDKGWRMA